MSAERHRGAPVHHQRRGHRTVRGALGDDLTWAFTAIPDKPADDRADQGPGAAGARRVAALLQARGRLRRRRAHGDLRAQERSKAPTGSRRARSTTRPTSPLVLPQARTKSGVGADHQGPDRASLGGRRRGDDAHRPRRGRQRGQERAVRAAAARAAVHQAAGARAGRAAPQSSRSMPTRRRACSPRSTR